MKLLKSGEKVHYIVCNLYTDKKPIILLQTELLFDQDKDLQQYRNNVHISLVKNEGNSLSADLEKLSEQMAKFPDHHTFVDEFIINMKNEADGKVEKTIRQMKQVTKVLRSMNNKTKSL